MPIRDTGEISSIADVVQWLSYQVLSSTEQRFLIRYLSYTSSTSAWAGLKTLYGRSEEDLRSVRHRILLKIPSDVLRELRATLDEAHTLPDLSEQERARVEATIEFALLLQRFSDRQMRPSAAKVPKPAPESTQEIARPSVLTMCPNTLLNVSASPTAFLEKLVILYTRLIASPLKVSGLRALVKSCWPIGDFQLPNAFGQLYSLGLIEWTDVRQPDALVVSISDHLPLPQFRQYCAQNFTLRITNNHRLLAALDYFGSASAEDIAKPIFNSVPSDLENRLWVWQALGAVERPRKRLWMITPAGRALVASLPLLPAPASEVASAIPSIATDDDWLDVL